MKKFFAIFTAVVLLPVSQTMAWVGGPFSNNSSLPGGDDGVYEAIATMTNGVGMYRFGVRNNGTSSQAFGGNAAGGGGAVASTPSNVQFNAGLLNAFSSNVWFYKGVTYYGTTFGMANSDMGIVSAIGNASASVGGEVPNPGVGQIIIPSINGAVIGTSSGNNIATANSSWVAKMEDKGPAFRFSGRGQINFTGSADIVSTVEAINPVNVSAGDGSFTAIGVGAGTAAGNTNTTASVNTTSPVTSPGGGTFTQVNNASTSESSISSYSRVGTGGEASKFEDRGHSRKFLVFGTKVSHTVSP